MTDEEFYEMEHLETLEHDARVRDHEEMTNIELLEEAIEKLKKENEQMKKDFKDIKENTSYDWIQNICDKWVTE